MTEAVVELPMEFRHPGHEALVSVWWTGMLMKRAFRATFGDQFPSEAQFNALRVIALSPDLLTQNEIAAKLMTDKANVSGLLASMQAAGLIKRTPVEGDRRSKHVLLTAKGRQLAKEAGEAYEEKVEQAMANLTTKEQVELSRLTRKVRDGLAGMLD
jgi:DNA-binding MarR family transcriptional regulator